MAYNVTRSCIQFILPMVIVFAVYASIYLRIKDRPIPQNGQPTRPSGSISPLRSAITSSTYFDQSHHNNSSFQGPFSSNQSEQNNLLNRRWNVLEGRRRRANIMIISIAVVFFLSWLPLNSLNLALEFSPDLFGSYIVTINNATRIEREGRSRDMHTIGKLKLSYKRRKEIPIWIFLFFIYS